jgi:pimeloyl-ACP methyl ester carboxylesterase
MKKSIITSDGVRIYYEVNRLDGKDFLVFVHGLSGNHTAFNPIIRQLNKKGISNLTLDLRGHGKSSKKADITIKKCALDICSIIKKEKIKNCILIGHCLGGPICLEIYKELPKHIKKIVLMNTTYASPFLGRKVNKKIDKECLSILKKISGYKHPLRKKFVYNNCEKYRNKSLLYIFLKDLLANPPETYIKSLIAYFSNNQEKLLGNIKIPVLIIGGKKDLYISYRASEIMHKKIKGSKLVIMEEADHIPVIREPELVFDMLFNFCRE